ncbi:alpha/beta fold hydrolase [Rhodococcus sp. MSC1_016]|uniref:alpha/beta fold hydrolase n=1 Tax=Rhodococcus sp. MSC1_016 TaxID=2909266 RepID=UPI00202FB492|nr:alpha/beta fold hydrolase [Rhodococcus sp. MSC1_016]
MSAPAVLDVAGRRTRVRVEGDPARPPLLLLHGIGRSLEDWGPQFSRLSGTHRVIALDIPGFGFSARMPERTTLEALARGVIETLDVLGEHRPLHVAGNSLGGALAMQLLLLDPERVASLVLANSAGFGAEVALPLRLLAVPVLGDIAVRLTSRAGARTTERLSFADPALATAARVEHALAIADQPGTGAVLLETTRALATPCGVKPGWREALTTAAGAHRRPTLVVWGDRDRVLAPHHLEAARRAFPHAETELFAGIGHMPQIECPDDFAARVLAFLATVDGMSTTPPPSHTHIARSGASA